MISVEQIQTHAAAHPRPVPNPHRAAAKQAIADRVVAAKRDGLAKGRHRKDGA